MKKIFLFIFILSFGITNAQTFKTFTSNGDTVTNTGTKTLTLPVLPFYDAASFQVVNTKISGTVAGNTLFQASNDGTNYVTLDTLTNTDQTTNTKIFTDVPSRYRFYRLSSTGSGTMAYRTYGYAVLKVKP